jgi:hypothetical protein
VFHVICPGLSETLTEIPTYIVTTNLFPHEGIVLWSGSSYAEALFRALW